eukprot:GFUD01029761.1.p1 GENE.GFUD01029761.1~~GFUD01029761.1.p1  ORF type:complete len:276 (-),score=95.50 GFUD01029761.1:40-867(-)
MTSQYLVYLCLVLSSCSLLSCLPAPQSSETSETSATSSEDAYGDYEDYGDYNENTKAITDNSTTGDPLGDLFKIGGSLAQGFLALLGEKVKFVNRLLADEDLRQQVGNTISVGLNLTGQIARVAVPVVQAAVQSVPGIINTSRATVERLNTEENQQRVRQIAGASSRVAQGVGAAASQVPELISQGSRLLGSVIKAANDTAPLILDGIQEFTDQLPLITGFASAYAEVNAEQAQKVAQTFYTSLQCDLQCRDVVDKDLKQECLVQFCTKEDEDEV